MSRLQAVSVAMTACIPRATAGSSTATASTATRRSSAWADSALALVGRDPSPTTRQIDHIPTLGAPVDRESPVLSGNPETGVRGDGCSRAHPLVAFVPDPEAVV